MQHISRGGFGLQTISQMIYKHIGIKNNYSTRLPVMVMVGIGLVNNFKEG